MKAAATALAVVLISLACSSCAVVRPWEREKLAKQVMSRGDRVEEAMCERTFLDAREGATGGNAVGVGGGCACN